MSRIPVLGRLKARLTPALHAACDKVVYGWGRSIDADELASLSKVEVTTGCETILGDVTPEGCWDAAHFAELDPLLRAPHDIPTRTPALIENVELVGGIIQLKDGRVIEESGMGQLEYLIKADRAPQVVFRRLAPTVHIDEAVCLTSALSRYYFHWMTESLPRAVQLADMGVLKPGVKIVIDGDDFPFQAQSLQALLGVLPEDLVPMARVQKSRVVIGRCWIPFYNHLRTARTRMIEFFPGSALRRLRDLSASAGEASQPRVIFIQRPAALPRSVRNVGALKARVPSIEVVETDTLGFVEQVELFRAARVIVSPHGAGLSNMVFSRDALVVELFPRGRRATDASCYLQMSRALSLTHHVVCVDSDPDTQHMTLSDDDVRAVGAIVNDWLEARP